MIATCPQRNWESTFLRCDNVSLQRCDNQKATLWQRCDNVILFAGKALPPPPLSGKNVKQIQIDANTIAYQSDHAPQSSLYPAPVKIGAFDYDTHKQAFQHIKAKSNNRPLQAERILLCRKTYIIKQMGDKVITSPKWDAKEEDLMYAIQLKNPELPKMLIATGMCELVEATRSTKSI